MVKPDVKDIVMVKWDSEPVFEELNDPAPFVISDFILPDPKHPILKFLPMMIWGIFCLIGLGFFLWSPTLKDVVWDEVPLPVANPGRTNRDWWNLAVQSWLFWCAFMALMPYCLLLVKNSINDVIEEAHRQTKITKVEHLKLKSIIFGPISYVAVAAIIIVFGLYDYNAWWLGDTMEEGWLYDSGGWEYIKLLADDNSITQAWYINEGVAIMWLIMWEMSWIFTAQFLWYAISFLIYLSKIIKYNYRNDARMVDRMKLHKPLTDKIIKVGLGFIPYLTLKFLYQITSVPWTSDLIVNTIMLVLFIFMIVAPPIMIALDLKQEANSALEGQKDKGLFALTDILNRLNDGENVSTDEAISALLYHGYVTEVQSREMEDKKQKEKQTKSVAGPTGSYASKEGANFARAAGLPLGM